MKEDNLYQLKRVLFTDLLKIRSKIFEKVLKKLDEPGTFKEVEDMLEKMMELDVEINKEISRKLRGKQLERMYKD